MWDRLTTTSFDFYKAFLTTPPSSLKRKKNKLLPYRSVIGDGKEIGNYLPSDPLNSPFVGLLQVEGRRYGIIGSIQVHHSQLSSIKVN